MVHLVLTCILLLVANISETFASGKVLWTQNQPIAIFESVSIANNEYVATADGYNFQQSADIELFEISGNGNPSWSYTASDAFIAGARDADTIAALSLQSDKTASIFAFSTNSTPIWTFLIPAQVLGLPDLVVTAVSFQGDTIAAAVILATGVRLYWFTQANTRNPSMNFYDFKNYTSVRAIAISGDGTILAAVLGSAIVVLETKTATIRFEKDLGFSTSDFCMSFDGNYFAYTFEQANVLWWTGSVYEFVGVFNNQGFIGGGCAISDTDVLGLGWSRLDYRQKMVQAYALSGSNEPTQLWSYSFPPNSGKYQDVVSAVSLSPKGDFVAVGAWGDGGNAPTVVVFRISNGTAPIFTYVTPGSMNDIALAANGGNTYVAAVGKHVHNNVFGDGGDAFLFQIA